MDRRSFLKGALGTGVAVVVGAQAIAPQGRAQCVTVTGAVVGGDREAIAAQLRDAMERAVAVPYFGKEAKPHYRIIHT